MSQSDVDPCHRFQVYPDGTEWTSAYVDDGWLQATRACSPTDLRRLAFKLKVVEKPTHFWG